MNQQLVLGILVGVLVLVSAFQAFQLAELNGRAQVGSAVVPAGAGQAQQQSSSAQQVALPAGLANVPNMVGGC